jgi:hypothetical protein
MTQDGSGSKVLARRMSLMSAAEARLVHLDSLKALSDGPSRTLRSFKVNRETVRIGNRGLNDVTHKIRREARS